MTPRYVARMLAPAGPDGVVTLGALLARLTPVVLDLLAAPTGVDAAVGRVLIVGAGDDHRLEAGDVVLLVGVDAAAPGLADQIRRCAEARSAAVVVKVSPESAPAVTRLAESYGVAALGAPASADWGQVFTLLRTAATVVGTADDRLDHHAADLFALADAIAGAVGGATTIEDRQLRVVAYSNLDQPIDGVRRDSILGRSVPGYVMERDEIVATYKRMWADTDIVRLPAGDKVRPRMGASVRAGDEVIGTIWVVEGDRPFDEAAERALRDSAPVAALHLLRHHAADDIDRRRRADTVRAALEGRRVAADLLGGASATVVAFAVLDSSADAADAAASVVRRRRLLDIVTYQLEVVDARSAAVELGGAVLAIVPEPGAGQRRQRAVVSDVVQRAAHAMKAEVVAGIGSTVGADATVDPAAIAASRWEAEQAVAVLTERAVAGSGSGSAPAVVTIDEVRSHVVIRRVRELVADDARTRIPHWETLARHDAEQHTDHVATLGAYLDAFGDVTTAADRLGVHPNTLRYRLKRIVELIGADLDDPAERFVLELQWRLR